MKINSLQKNRNFKRHHNNKGLRQIKNGKCAKYVKKLAKKLGIKYNKKINYTYLYED